MHLEVQSKDIKGAKRNDWNRCPIARALRRQFPGNHVEVFDGHIILNGEYFSHTDETREYALAWNDGQVSPAKLQMPEFGRTLKYA